ncbi:MAG TPA: ATP-binding protein [Phycisphaerales bacterium]|nr:ATP-binding protein [Phycisphaerales bacterium]
MLVLTVIQGPDKGRTFELPDNEPQMIGRSSESLPLSDGTVSRRHAELTPDKGDWYLRDLGSQNATLVNGIRIEPNARIKLKPGDQIRAGMTLFSFGRTERRADPQVRMLREDQVDTSIERSLSSEDSVILALDGDTRAGTALGATVAGGANSHLRVLYRLTTLVSTLPEREKLFEGVFDLIFSELRPERAVFLIDEGDGPVPSVVRFATKAPAGQAQRIDVSRTILRHALDKGEGILASNAMSDERFRKGDSVQRMAIRSAMCVPVRSAGRTFGAIYADSSIGAGAFNADQLALMTAIGQQTGLALSHLELLSQKLQTERLAAIGQTVASLSHSIKNILQGLRGGADVVEMGLRKDDLKVSRGGWPILKRNLDRIIALTLNMLAYSRPRTLDVELTKVQPLLDDCASLLADQCKLRGVALIVDVDPDTPPVPIDAAQVHQALMNLMSNAVEAVEAKTGVVTVRAKFLPEDPGRPAGRGQLRIDIIDNGPGIQPELQRRVFEPFFTTKGLRGTGLGLAVTSRIVESHNGKVLLSTVPGKGATFSVVLPIDPATTIDPSATTDTRQRVETTWRAPQ